MRQLEEIHAQCRREAKEHYDKHLDTFQGVGSEAEVCLINASMRRLDKMEEMYNILTMLESYLQRPSLDGRPDRQEIRKKLKESLDSL
jgi:hypothetical protein